MNHAAAATASAKSWKKLAEGLETEAAPFIVLGDDEVEQFLAELLYVTPMLAAGHAYAMAAQATARSFPRD